jgi:outer membrane protein assembly factor BamB
LASPNGNQRLSSLHPVIWDQLVLVVRPHQVMAFDVGSGQPAFGTQDGLIYADEPAPAVRLLDPLRPLGEPQQTSTVVDGRFYARMGSPFTHTASRSRLAQRSNYLICLDLRADGRIVWKLDAESPLWSFEGSPLVEGSSLYVGVRTGGPRPASHLACYDARSGKLRWRRLIGSADAPHHDQRSAATQNLLTFAEGTVYYNTNLGVIAAIEAQQGRTRWMHLYERIHPVESTDIPARGWRALAPCIADHGRLYAAPADSERILCLESNTGRLLWTAPCRTVRYASVQYLLGVVDGLLLGGGWQLICLDAATGDLLSVWPEGPVAQTAGRGAIAGRHIAWPVGDRLHLVEAARGASRGVLMPVSAVSLPLSHGGHMAASIGRLVVAGEDLLVGLEARQQPPHPSSPLVPGDQPTFSRQAVP